MKKWIVMLAAVSCFSFNVVQAEEGSAAEITIASSEAAGHVGKQAKVCGPVGGGVYFESTSKKLTILNLGQAHPNQDMDVVIKHENRAKFPEPPETAYAGKKVCVTGVISMFKQRVQIEVSSPSQITVSAE